MVIYGEPALCFSPRDFQEKNNYTVVQPQQRFSIPEKSVWVNKGEISYANLLHQVDAEFFVK